MDKTTLGIIAVLGAAVPLGAAQAAVPPVDAQTALHASSVAELLNPIPNAMEIMKSAQAQAAADDAKSVEVAQIFYHHHHHHHHFLRRLFHHHHHHHWHRHWHHHHHMM